MISWLLVIKPEEGPLAPKSGRSPGFGRPLTEVSSCRNPNSSHWMSSFGAAPESALVDQHLRCDSSRRFCSSRCSWLGWHASPALSETSCSQRS